MREIPRSEITTSNVCAFQVLLSIEVVLVSTPIDRTCECQFPYMLANSETIKNTLHFSSKIKEVLLFGLSFKNLGILRREFEHP